MERRSPAAPVRAPLARIAVLAVLAALAAACSPPKAQTTFLRSVDLVDMTNRMSESFAACPAVADRTLDSPRWIISIDKVVNNTNQVIPENEKWAYVGRLRSLLAQTRLADRKNIAWIVPPEKWPIIQEELRMIGEPPDLRRKPTHLMTAEFSALTTTSADGRTDAYFCGYQLVDLRTGALTWEDAWEVKRAVSGRTYD